MKKLFAISILIFISTSCQKKQEEMQTVSGYKTEQNSPEREAQEAQKIDSSNITIMKFEEQNFDFGSIEKDSKVQHYYVFTNTGDKPLTISKVEVGCGCTSPTYPKKPVLPNQKDSILIGFNSKNQHSPFNKSVTVYANTLEPILLTFTGTINP